MAGKSVPKVKQKLDKKDLALSLAFLLPAILITVIFVIYPVFDTVGLSFRKWNGMFGAAKQWVGLENYQNNTVCTASSEQLIGESLCIKHD